MSIDFVGLLKTIAPWIGTALGGPLGGMAIEAAASALGLSDKTESALKTALSGATPEQMLALKKADQDFSAKMQELGFKQITDLESIAANDRASARSMQVSKPSFVPAVLSFMVTVGYFTILGLMLSQLVKATESPALLIMLGSLGTAWGMVMSFWFGTTRESGRKTELIAQSTPIEPK